MIFEMQPIHRALVYLLIHKNQLLGEQPAF